MNEKATHEYTPFLIEYRIHNNGSGWGHWKVRPEKYWCREDRDAAFLKLRDRECIEYRCATDEAELDRQLEAMERLK